LPLSLSAASAPSDFRVIVDSLEGEWKGVLEYRDFGSDERVEIPAGMSCEAFETELTTRRAFAFVDPGRVVRLGEIVRFDASGPTPTCTIIPEDGPIDAVRGGLERWRVESWSVDGPNAWRLVMTSEGTDNGRPALFRTTQTLRDGAVSAVKEVDYTDDEATTGVAGERFEFRNAVRLARVQPDAKSLVGVWSIDLRPTPDAPAYLVRMEIAEVADGSFSGAFYNGSPISNARINTNWDGVRFAFTTSDGTGVYHTQGVLRGGRVEGSTHAIGRDYLGVWSGSRAE
jgi:hypothetical protein